MPLRSKNIATYTNENPSLQTPKIDSLEDSLFACFIGLGAGFLLARVAVLRNTPAMMPALPILVYQDVLALAILLWGFQGLFAITVGLRKRWWLAIAGWTLSLLLAAYTAIDVIVYNLIMTPLTLRLVAISGYGRGVEATVADQLWPAVRAVLAALGVVLLVARAIWRLSPALLRQLRGGFHSFIGVSVILVYVAASHAWVASHLPYPPAAYNAEWALLSSLVADSKPIVAASIPSQYYTDFLPGNHLKPGSMLAAITPVAAARRARPLNVIMVVMESVGEHPLQLYGAPYPDTPELIRLSRRAVVFNRIYVSQPNTSSAMAALYCSLYPQHDWRSITDNRPELPVPCLPAILKQNGYRTAFIHSGNLSFDREEEFLRVHGFNTVISQGRELRKDPDSELLLQFLSWIDTFRSAPFFVTIWTLDTHHPYRSASQRNYDVLDPPHNRYLNAIFSTDALIGKLVEALNTLKLADNTLVVITGDHGEAFGEHGRLSHDFTVYDEEVHVPLLFIDPGNTLNGTRVNSVGRQIDIAPTILQILGYDPPTQWQGSSLTQSSAHRRAYVFSSWASFTMGVVDNDMKYICDFDKNRTELYNLSTDPDEKHDLGDDPKFSAFSKDEQSRLEAWLLFQNSYLKRFGGS